MGFTGASTTLPDLLGAVDLECDAYGHGSHIRTLTAHTTVPICNPMSTLELANPIHKTDCSS